MISKQCVNSVLALTVAVILTACSEPHHQMRALGPEATILAFGDSLTAGTGAPAGQSYPDYLQKYAGLTVINAGVPGEISAAGLRRLPGLLEEHQPQLVIICHGGNDLLRKMDTSKLRRNLEQMIAAADNAGAQVFLLGVPKPSLMLQPLAVYGEIAEQFRLAADLKIISKVLAQKKLKSDPVHPNGAGYEEIAGAIHKALSNAGAY